MMSILLYPYTQELDSFSTIVCVRPNTMLSIQLKCWGHEVSLGTKTSKSPFVCSHYIQVTLICWRFS